MLLNPLILFLSSGILLAFSTPSLGMWPLVFIAFIPILYCIEHQFSLGRYAFFRMFFLGFVFSYVYAVSCLYWLTSLNWVAVVAVPAIYAFIYSFFAPGIVLGLRAGLRRTYLLLWSAYLWVSLEVLVADLFLPIPSISVGYLVWPFRSIIQVADVTGVFGVSFWIVTVNLALYSLVTKGVKQSLPFISLAVVLMSMFMVYGHFCLTRNFSENRTSLPVNIVYTSVLSEDKKKETTKNNIFKLLKSYTIQSIEKSPHRVGLVVWPETSIPVFLRSVRDKHFIEGLIELSQKNEISILIGALSFQHYEGESLKKFNSAFLIPERGYISQEYRKQILAPFTETIPLRNKLPATVINFLPTPKLDAGVDPGLMKLFDGTGFGVLICYEAFFPDFVRQSVNENCGFLVNITNDHHAFGNLIAAYKIPLPHLVFRAIENRRFLLRSANWGYSMVISPVGQILDITSIGTQGYLSSMVTPSYDESFFSKHGFIFAKILLSTTLIWAAVLFIKIWKAEK